MFADNLTWLNGANDRGWELVMTRLTYGNEAELAYHYSHAVILIEVPKQSGRPGI